MKIPRTLFSGCPHVRGEWGQSLKKKRRKRRTANFWRRVLGGPSNVKKYQKSFWINEEESGKWV